MNPKGTHLHFLMDTDTPLPHDKIEILLNLKLFSYHCEENGKPIMDWTRLFKAQFEQFRSIIAYYRAIKKVTIPPSSKINLSRLNNATMPRNVTSSTMVMSAPMNSLPSSPSAAIARASSSTLATPVSKCLLFSESQDVEDTGNITELQHVLHTILPEAVDSLLVKALERNGFNEIQDVLLMNQAERDMLVFLDANDDVTPVPHGKRT